ncbi:MAG: hydrogenase maturation nickel metallochaperone HypA [Bacilli bacterium]|jgi:hydrogenase nickel incorporation protein HypA/HybF|nr:hydrogenase maturation nickel metallochaperone HypA [Bacilli bacterium]
MHELGIVFSVIQQVEKAAKENDVKKVKKVTLEVGEVSTIVPSYFEDCWKWSIKKSEVMNECELEMIIIKAGTYCEDCGKTYSTTQYGKKCPYCGSEKTYLYTGKDVVIKSLEVV